MSRIESVAKLLDQLGIKYRIKEKTILSMWRTDKWSDFPITFTFTPNEVWLMLIGWRKMPDMSPEERCKLFRKMLEESYNYNGAKYGIDKDGDITITVETADTDLTANELQRYVRVLLQAADELWDWLPH